MTTHRFSPDEIVPKLLLARQLEAEGASPAEVCRQLQVTELTYLRWYKKFDGLDEASVSRLRRLEQENAGLRAALARIQGHLTELRDAMGENQPIRPLWHQQRAR